MTKEKYDKADIDRGLYTLPSLIASTATEHNNALEVVDMAKQELKVKEAISLMSQSIKDLNVSEKKALVDQEIAEFAIAVIKSETSMRAKKIKLEQLRDSFDSVRKAANILIEEMKAFGVKETK